MNGGANFPGIETASSKKDAVKKAFNQEYQATMKAMANAADRARKQILDQKLAAASHGQSNQPSQNGNPTTQSAAPPTGPGPTSPKPPGTPSGGGSGAPSSDPTMMVMIEIANELRRIIVSEIDMRMNHLANQVEQAIAHSLPSLSGNQAAASTQPVSDTTETIISNTPQKTPDATTTTSAATTVAQAPSTTIEAETSPAQPLKKDTTSNETPANSDE